MGFDGMMGLSPLLAAWAKVKENPIPISWFLALQRRSRSARAQLLATPRCRAPGTGVREEAGVRGSEASLPVAGAPAPPRP